MFRWINRFLQSQTTSESPVLSVNPASAHANELYQQLALDVSMRGRTRERERKRERERGRERFSSNKPRS
jgi:hypothetical protein